MARHVYTSIIFAGKGLCTLVKFVSEIVSDNIHFSPSLLALAILIGTTKKWKWSYLCHAAQGSQGK